MIVLTGEFSLYQNPRRGVSLFCIMSSQQDQHSWLLRTLEPPQQYSLELNAVSLGR